MITCDWCGKREDNLRKISFLGASYSICKKCYECHEDSICITCGESVDGGLPINGECTACSQLRYARIEKQKSDILHGLGLEAIGGNPTSSFTEDDYNRWVTFSHGSFNPEARKINRLNWMKNKLVIREGWDIKDYEENKDDILYILDTYAHKVFNSQAKFILRNSEWGGSKIIARKGNVIVIETKEGGGE